MAMFNYEIKHKPARANGNANYLSRYPYEQPGVLEDVGDIVIRQITATSVPPKFALLLVLERKL